MDFDVVTLRPLAPLLTSGFAFVAGRQYLGTAEKAKVVRQTGRSTTVRF
jgi:hypothetical protein